MGTNYYVEEKEPCLTCHRGYENIHIGKSSAGWQFCFASYAEHGLLSVKAWREYLKGKPIFDEYGKDHEPEAFWALVESKQDGMNAFTAGARHWGTSNPLDYESLDEDGYRISRRHGFT